MQLCQVLNEEQRQERFSASLQRKRPLDEGDEVLNEGDELEENDDEVTDLEVNSIQDLRSPLSEEGKDLLVPKEEEEEEDHNLSGSSSCISLENPRLLRSTAVPRHLCTPPLLIPNNNSPPNAFSLNLQQLLQEQQQLQEQHNQLQKPAATTKFTRRKCSTEDASCSRGIPPLIANPWLHLAASPARLPEARQPQVPLQKPVIKWQKKGGQTNGILMTSSTRYEDLSDKEEPLTFTRSPSQISFPESCHPQIQLNDLQHYQHKKFSKAMIICHMLLSCIFATVASNFLLDRCEESDSSQTNKEPSVIRSIVWKTLFGNKN